MNHLVVPTGSPLGGGDVAVSVFYTNQPSFPTRLYSALVSVSSLWPFLFTALSVVLLSVTSSDNYPLSHSVLPVFFCLIGPFNRISLYEILPQP